MTYYASIKIRKGITYYYCDIVIFLLGNVIPVAPPGPYCLPRWWHSVSCTRGLIYYTYLLIYTHTYVHVHVHLYSYISIYTYAHIRIGSAISAIPIKWACNANDKIIYYVWEKNILEKSISHMYICI